MMNIPVDNALVSDRPDVQSGQSNANCYTENCNDRMPVSIIHVR